MGNRIKEAKIFVALLVVIGIICSMGYSYSSNKIETHNPCEQTVHYKEQLQWSQVIL